MQDIEIAISRLNEEFGADIAAGGDGQTVKTRLDVVSAEFVGLQDQINADFPDYTNFTQPAGIDVTEIAAMLRPDEAMVLFATSNGDEEAGLDGSVILAVTRETIATGHTATRSQLQDISNRLRCAAALTDAACGKATGTTRGSFSLEEDEGPAEPEFDLALAHTAYRMTIEPVERALAGKTSLIVVPDQTLISLPFHLLVQSEPANGPALGDADWLIRDMSVFVIPTVASLHALRTRSVAAPDGDDRFLGIGDPLIGVQRNGKIEFDCYAEFQTALSAGSVGPVLDKPMKRGNVADETILLEMSALPDTRCELQNAVGFFDAGSLLLLQADATEARLKSMNLSGELAKFRTISFATHGLIAGEVGRHDAGLVLTPPSHATQEDDGLLTTGEIAELKLNADIVFLSACNTAAAGGGSDQGLSGLANAFFYAGARSLLVSHWPVYSDAATELTSHTLANMDTDPEIGFAEALRQSMLTILDDPAADDRMRHPAYWAPFMVVGEGAAL